MLVLMRTMFCSVSRSDNALDTITRSLVKKNRQQSDPKKIQ